MTPLFTIIEALHALGFSIFPLWPRSKRPAIDTWTPFQTERASIETLRSWFRDDRNAAVVTGAISNVSVVDADSAAALAWCAQLLETPLTVRTARGVHLYYRYAPGLPAFIYPDDALRIEVKSNGRYVLAPGSTHPTGVRYEVVGGRLPARIEDLPPFPVDHVVDRRTHAPAADAPYEFPDDVGVGERHDQLFRLVRSFKALGADRDTTRFAIGEANRNQCRPPVVEDASFEAWFHRAWTLHDRPLPYTFADSLGDPFGDPLGVF